MEGQIENGADPCNLKPATIMFSSNKMDSKNRRTDRNGADPCNLKPATSIRIQ